MLTILTIWIAGGFAAIGALKGISVVTESTIPNEEYIYKFIQSWYAFGQIILIMLAELGNILTKKD